MKHKLSAIASAFAVLLCLSASAFGQETTGVIEVTTKDPQGGAVTGVTITIQSRSRVDAANPTATGAGAFTRTVTTDENGFARVLQIPPGFYTVATTAVSGFGATTVTDVEVTLGRTTPVNITLRAGDVRETVTVTASDVVSIDPTSNRIQTNITAQAAELLPKGTNFTSLLQVAPAVRNEPLSGGFQVDGASGSENTFIIDGQEVTNFRTGTLNGNNNIPFQFVQEVQVKSSGFEAEFGGATGGVINVVTKGGSNEWHGEFGTSFQPAGLQAGPRRILTNAFGDARYFQPPKDEGTNHFPTFNLSGPIIEDRAWFFASYSPQIRNTRRTINFIDTDDESIVGTETYNLRQTNHYAFMRLDSNIFNNLRFNGTWTWNPIAVEGELPALSDALSGSPVDPADLRDHGGRQNSQNVTGQLTWTPNSKFVLTARGGYSFLNEAIGSYGVENIVGQARIFISGLSVTSAIPAEAGGQRGSFNRLFSEQLLFDASRRRTFDADASYYVSGFGGRHLIKGGYQLNALANDVFNTFIDQVSLRYGRDINFTSGVPASILPPTPGAIGSGLLQRFSEKGSASSRNQAIYIQDNWQPTSRLSLNFGVRAERENAPSFIPGQASITFGFGDKIAPRLGFAYDLTGDGRTKLFASYGRFFDRFKYELPRGSFGGNFFRVDYFEIFPGAGAFTNFTPASILGSNPDIPGGRCPITSGLGRTRCQLDFRVASNSGLPLLEAGGIDPDIKPFRQTEFTVGMERDLGSGFLFSSRFTHKQVDRAVEDIGFHNEAGSEIYIIGNPGEGLAREIYEGFGFDSPKAVRDYDALELRLDKHSSKRYYFNASYTFSRLYGNYSGLASSDEDGRTSPNVNRYFDQPFSAFTANAELDNGRLPTDRPHVFKFYGAYTLDWNDQFGALRGNSTEFSAFTTAQSGTPLTTRFTFQSYDSIILDRRGDLGRTEAFTQTDFAIRHKVRFGESERFMFVFDLDILNLFNEDNVLGVFDNISGFNFSGEEIGLSSDSIQAGGDFQRIPTLDRIRAIINDPDEGGGPDERYGLANSFQAGRSVRLGFRFIF
ncbi:MAG TPA: TonB-dependent receptor [Pyrinomonadaceae bacterium]|nr:TonB-dependent receptor [Pyrinomonadaceae bacterium]